MFYCSWELFSQEKFLSPKGPNFNPAPLLTMTVDGIKIQVKVPGHRPATQAERIDPAKRYELSDEYGMRIWENNGVKSRSRMVVLRNWAFYGPWFTGLLGSIEMAAIIFKPLPDGYAPNLFHPRAFESAVAEFLTSHYGHDFSFLEHGEQSFLAPSNWQPRKGLPCAGVRFDVVPNPHTMAEGVKCYFVAPISHEHLFIAHCDINRSGVFTDIKPKPKVDDWIDLKPFTTLANQVLDSVQIKLSPEAEAAQQEALQGLSEADKQLVKDFPPLKWTKSDLVVS